MRLFGLPCHRRTAVDTRPSHDKVARAQGRHSSAIPVPNVFMRIAGCPGVAQAECSVRSTPVDVVQPSPLQFSRIGRDAQGLPTAIGLTSGRWVVGHLTRPGGAWQQRQRSAPCIAGNC